MACPAFHAPSTSPAFTTCTPAATAGRKIYANDADRWRYLGILGRVTERMDWMCLSYCLMGNHVHLLLETRSPNLSAGMHRLHGAYAQYFNRRHVLSGHLFQGRFDSPRIESDPQLWMTAAYIARNPVDAGLCREAADWPWSSHAAIVEGRSSCLDRGRATGVLLRRPGRPRPTAVPRARGTAGRRANLNGDCPL